MVYCGNCGKPVALKQPTAQLVYPPPPSFSQPIQNPAPSQKPISGGCRRPVLIALIVVAVLSICGVIAGVIVITLSGASILDQFKTQTSSMPSGGPPQTAFNTEIPTALSNRVATPLPQPVVKPSASQTAVPPQPMPTASSVTAIQKSILLDETSKMTYPNNDQYRVDFSQQQAWIIELKQPGIDVVILPFGQLDSNSPAISAKLHLTTSAPGQIAGVRCMFQNSNNYYQVAFKDKSFAIGEMINGSFTPLTSPYWKPSQFIGSQGLTGGADIEVDCNPYGVGVSVNGTAEIPLQSGENDNYNGGQVAIFAESGANQVNGFYTFASLANVTIGIEQ